MGIAQRHEITADYECKLRSEDITPREVRSKNSGANRGELCPGRRKIVPNRMKIPMVCHQIDEKHLIPFPFALDFPHVVCIPQAALVFRRLGGCGVGKCLGMRC